MNRQNQFKKTGRKSQNVKSKKLGNPGMGRIERMEHPPQVNGYEISHSIRLRYTVTAAVVSQAITPQNVLDTVLIATTATVGYNLFDIFRVRQVEVWGQAALGTPSTITLLFAQNATGDQSIHTDTSLGVKPAYVKAVPSDRSLASFFNVTSNATLFLVSAPAGSILDLSCDFRTTNSQATAAQNALVAATAGELYYRGLDGVAIATTNFPPILGVTRI
jgi:hypothetical protein